MFTCEKCGSLYNITKDVRNVQKGGKINKTISDIHQQFMDNDMVDSTRLEKITFNDLVNNEIYEKMTSKNKKRLVSKIKAVDKNFISGGQDADQDIVSNASYFICKFCQNHKPIEPGTLLYSKSYTSVQDQDNENYKNYVDDNTLLRTRNYICKNKNCPTHTNAKDKQAVLTKNNQHQIVYICTTCKTDWVGTA